MVSWRGCFSPAITSTISPSERSKQLSRKTSHIHSVNTVKCKTYCNLHFADSTIARFPKPSDYMHSIQPCRLQRQLGKMRTPHVQEPRSISKLWLKAISGYRWHKQGRTTYHPCLVRIAWNSNSLLVREIWWVNLMVAFRNCSDRNSKRIKRFRFSSAAGPFYICIRSFQVSLRMIWDLPGKRWKKNDERDCLVVCVVSNLVIYNASRGCSTFWLTVAMTDGHVNLLRLPISRARSILFCSAVLQLLCQWLPTTYCNRCLIGMPPAFCLGGCSAVLETSSHQQDPSVSWAPNPYSNCKGHS